MALTRCLLILLLVAMTATTSATADRLSFYSTKCYPPPTPTADGNSAFRRNLHYLLDALPSAAAPTGFASLQNGSRAGADRALVLGLCYRGTPPKPCRRCLSNAGRKITEQCGDASRRANFWDEHCVLAYADGANYSSFGADQDFGNGTVLFFSDDTVTSLDVVSVQSLVALAPSLAPLAAKGSLATADATAGNRTVRVAALCATDRAAADCVSCLRDASLSVAKSWGRSAVVGRVTEVLGSNCFLLFEILTPTPVTPPLPLGEKIRRMIMDNLLITVFIALVVVFLIVVVIDDVCARRAIKARNAAAAVALGDMSKIRTTK